MAQDPILSLTEFYAPTGAERCGFVLKDGTVVETRNVSTDSENGFDMPAEEIIQYADLAKATWHTHPNQNSNLSKEDMAMFLAWPDLEHVVVGSDGVRVFKARRNTVIQVEFHGSPQNPPSRPVEEVRA